jgi:hypothetical protein
MEIEAPLAFTIIFGGLFGMTFLSKRALLDGKAWEKYKEQREKNERVSEESEAEVKLARNNIKFEVSVKSNDPIMVSEEHRAPIGPVIWSGSMDAIIRYYGEERKITIHDIDLDTTGVPRFYAFCHLRNDERTFRLDAMDDDIIMNGVCIDRMVLIQKLGIVDKMRGHAVCGEQKLADAASYPHLLWHDNNGIVVDIVYYSEFYYDTFDLFSGDKEHPKQIITEIRSKYKNGKEIALLGHSRGQRRNRVFEVGKITKLKFDGKTVSISDFINGLIKK